MPEESILCNSWHFGPSISCTRSISCGVRYVCFFSLQQPFVGGGEFGKEFPKNSVNGKDAKMFCWKMFPPIVWETRWTRKGSRTPGRVVIWTVFFKRKSQIVSGNRAWQLRREHMGKQRLKSSLIGPLMRMKTPHKYLDLRVVQHSLRVYIAGESRPTKQNRTAVVSPFVTPTAQKPCRG